MATCSGVYSNNETCNKCKNKVTCILVANTESRIITRMQLLDEKLLLIMQALSSLIDRVQEYNKSQDMGEVVEIVATEESEVAEVPKGLVATVKAKFKGNKNAS